MSWKFFSLTNWEIIMSLFKKNTAIEGAPQIAFYKDAAPHGEHGRIRVTNKALKITNIDVAFVFVGHIDPLSLNLTTMRMIWDAAEAQGYIPLELTKYGSAL